MRAAGLIVDNDHLVSSSRLGAALFRARTQSGRSLAAIARSSDGRFLPDQLVAVERGVAVVCDDDVAALVAAYELAAKPWVPAAGLDLVLDRATASDLDPSGRAGGHVTPPRSIAERFVALSVLLGVDSTSGPLQMSTLAEALEVPLTAAIDLVQDTLHTGSAGIGEAIDRLGRRYAVPQLGFRVGETAMGTVLVAPRRGSSQPTARLVAGGPLADLIG